MVPRVFVDLPLTAGSTIALPERAAHHVATVLRGRVGDALTLFNGLGGEFSGRLVALEKRRVLVELLAQHAIEREAGLQITLAQGLPQGDKMDWVVQKATELGVAQIVPLETATTLVRLRGERAEKRAIHLHQVAIAACEQCWRNRIPGVTAVQPLSQFLQQAAKPGAQLVLDPEASLSLPAWVAAHRPVAVTLLVGPESGLTTAEIALAGQRGFVPVSLGHRVLRTETAGLAAVAAILTICNAW